MLISSFRHEGNERTICTYAPINKITHAEYKNKKNNSQIINRSASGVIVEKYYDDYISNNSSAFWEFHERPFMADFRIKLILLRILLRNIHFGRHVRQKEKHKKNKSSETMRENTKDVDSFGFTVGHRLRVISRAPSKTNFQDHYQFGNGKSGCEFCSVVLLNVTNEVTCHRTKLFSTSSKK